MERLTDHRREFPWRFRTSFISPFLSFCILYPSAFREENRSSTDLSPVSVDNPYMVYWFRFLTQHRVFLTTGGGSTGVSRRPYFDHPLSVFIRYTPVLPICRSAREDLLRTITATISGTIVAEFSARIRPPPPKRGKFSADCAT